MKNIVRPFSHRPTLGRLTRIVVTIALYSRQTLGCASSRRRLEESERRDPSMVSSFAHSTRRRIDKDYFDRWWTAYEALEASWGSTPNWALVASTVAPVGAEV